MEPQNPPLLRYLLGDLAKYHDFGRWGYTPLLLSCEANTLLYVPMKTIQDHKSPMCYEMGTCGTVLDRDPVNLEAIAVMLARRGQ